LEFTSKKRIFITGKNEAIARKNGNFSSQNRGKNLPKIGDLTQKPLGFNPGKITGPECQQAW
jgi:hypothetical protein